MKIYFYILCAFFYGLNSSGLSINLHFCHDSFAGFSLNYGDDCCCTDEKNNADCCSDLNISLKQNEGLDSPILQSSKTSKSKTKIIPINFSLGAISSSQNTMVGDIKILPKKQHSKKERNRFLRYQKLIFYA